MTPALRLLEPLLHWRRLDIEGGVVFKDSSGSENISWFGLRCCEPSGFRSDAWVFEFQSTQNGVTACVVSPSGFSGAAGFSVLKLGVQE